MALKLSPEYLVAGYIGSATNGRILGPRLRRLLTVIIAPFWTLLLVGLIFTSIGLYKSFTERSEARQDLKEEVRQYNEGHLVYDEAYNNFGRAIERIESRTTYEIKEQIEILIYLVAALIAPWLILKLIYWIVDADKSKIKDSIEKPV
jgi:hypothetical protein